MKLQIPFISVLCIIILSGCNSINRLYVPLGNAKAAHAQASRNSTRIYLERQGNIYPERYIDDRLVRYGLLKQAYQDKQLFSEICTEEGVQVNTGDNLQAQMQALQSKLVAKLTHEINEKSKGKEVVFLIHGYNDHPDKPSGNGAIAEYDMVRKTITQKYPDRSFYFVEVLWDGLSGQNGSTMLRPFNAIKIWNNAQVSATYAGLELRRIIAGLEADRLYVITHSHGAGVITNALFNVIKFDADYYHNGGRFITERYNNPLYETPRQEIHIGMLAPAIPGLNVFREYSHRTISGTNRPDPAMKNYHFIVGFNRHDPVTRKFYTSAAFFGTTTLASRRSELKNTVDFIGDRNLFDYSDFSLYNGKWQMSHSWFKYMSNPVVNEFLDKLFTDYVPQR